MGVFSRLYDEGATHCVFTRAVGGNARHAHGARARAEVDDTRACGHAFHLLADALERPVDVDVDDSGPHLVVDMVNRAGGRTHLQDLWRWALG